MGITTTLANPTRFMSYSGKILPVTWILALVLIVAGLYYAFPGSPPDYQMGEVVRLMYVHPQAAWLAMLCYVLMAIAALGTIIWRHPLADVLQKAAAPIGAAFALLGLVTGMLWGQPTWGTYWVWDARLTSFLILFIMFLGLIAIWATVEDPGRAARIAAILTLVGAVNLPIIYFSVQVWSTLHQPQGVLQGQTDAHFLPPMFLMLGGYTFLFISILLLRMRTEILGRRVRSMQLTSVGAEA
ncbi:MAG: heme ABC transporter permease CcmC [Bauldia sp.]|nr:heme ABC transporter permease CcmC [Bauldia sp.]